MLFTLWITELCNLHCKYCYVDNMKTDCKAFDEKNSNPLLSFIKKHSDNDYNILNFFGGEPLMAIDKIKIIVDETKKYEIPNLQMWMTTNGTLLTDEICRFIKSNNIQVTISIDGEEKTHNANRVFFDGAGSYNKTISGYKLLRKNEIESIRIRGTYNSKSVFQLDKNIDYMINNFEGDIIFAPDFFDENWDENSLDELEKNILKYKKVKRVSLLDDCDEISICGGGSSSIYIDSSGDLYPCSYVVKDKNYYIGDIFNGIDLKKLECLDQTNKRRLKSCAGCSEEYKCRSFKCKYLNKILTGNELEASPVICGIQNIEHRVRNLCEK